MEAKEEGRDGAGRRREKRGEIQEMRMVMRSTELERGGEEWGHGAYQGGPEEANIFPQPNEDH